MSAETNQVGRPDVASTLAGLKDFQRNTVEHVHSRFFDENDPTRRFLVADEVGLGKTLVARGVTAKLVEELWDEVERIDVVYICSNAAIAAQNIRRLQIAGGADFTRATRLTLLPRVIHDLRSRKLNFISLTPGTSFTQHSATGTGEERALLYLMLQDAWDLGDRKSPINVFCHQKTRQYFEWDIAEIGTRIDPGLRESFVENLEGTDLREKFFETEQFFQRRQWKTAPEEGRRLQHQLIDQLRRALSRSCVDALEPDLVILDEFQRFQHLLKLDGEGNPASDAGELAHQLFDYSDPDSGEHARTLLLSATPYTAFGVDPDDPDSSHHQAFTETVSFLLDDPPELNRLQGLFRDQRDLILGDPSSTSPGQSVSGEIRKILLSCMCRTERLGSTSDRDGMLKQVNHPGQDLEPEDILAYTSLQDLGRELEVSDLIEFWKSSPYLLNMMDGYKFDRALSTLIEEGGQNRVFEHLRDGAPGVLDRNQIEQLEEVDPGNPRLRELWREIEEAGAHRLLWISPSVTYYKPDGPFAGGGASRFTKRLVFSNWMIVPKAISSLLSYLTEQSLIESGGRGPHGYADQGRTAGSLKTLFRDGRVAPSFALVYPSKMLASFGDPLRYVRESGEGLASEEVRRAIEARLEEHLAALQPNGSREGNPDQAWYWAAPILLDVADDPEETKRFLADMYEQDPAFRGEEAADDREDTTTQWHRCLRGAEELLAGELTLGPKPDDLAEVMAKLALGGFGNCAYRGLSRGERSGLGDEPGGARIGGLKTGLALRAMFNLPHATHLLQSLQGERSNGNEALWLVCLDYAIAGNLQATLDEFAHLLTESQASDLENDELALQVADSMVEAIGIRTTTASATFFDVGSDLSVEQERRKLRTRFAIPFVKGQSDDSQEVERVEHVRAAFNSPFWPFVLTSTSVGQEGLDFHLYCHAVVHWNLPSNPVDLEQREGRVHRYKNHAVRRNLAKEFGDHALQLGGNGGDIWNHLFTIGEDNRPPDQTDLWPYWLFTPGGGDAEPFLIERHVMAMELSRDEAKLHSLLKSLVLYRSVLGQPRQEDLVTVLERHLSEDIGALATRTRIDLSPPGPGERPMSDSIK